MKGGGKREKKRVKYVFGGQGRIARTDHGFFESIPDFSIAPVILKGK